MFIDIFVRALLFSIYAEFARIYIASLRHHANDIYNNNKDDHLLISLFKSSVIYVSFTIPDIYYEKRDIRDTRYFLDTLIYVYLGATRRVILLTTRLGLARRRERHPLHTFSRLTLGSYPRGSHARRNRHSPL